MTAHGSEQRSVAINDVGFVRIERVDGLESILDSKIVDVTTPVFEADFESALVEAEHRILDRRVEGLGDGVVHRCISGYGHVLGGQRRIGSNRIGSLRAILEMVIRGWYRISAAFRKATDHTHRCQN